VSGAELAAELGRLVPNTTAMVATINTLRTMTMPRRAGCRYLLVCSRYLLDMWFPLYVLDGSAAFVAPSVATGPTFPS
jgi:hypothetical protein